MRQQDLCESPELVAKGSPRPTSKTPAVVNTAIRNLIDLLVDECGLDDPEEPGVFQSLKRAVDGEGDGYKIARSLDHYGWEVDAKMVATLDEYGGLLWRAEISAVEAWVRATAPVPKYSVGSPVRVTTRGDAVDGAIVGIDTEWATYTVCCPSRGHVSGTHAGTHGYILPWEQVDA